MYSIGSRVKVMFLVKMDISFEKEIISIYYLYLRREISAAYPSSHQAKGSI